MKKQLIAVLALASIAPALSARVMTKDAVPAAKITVENKTQTTARVDLEREGIFNNIRRTIRPGQQQTFVSADKCFKSVEVRLGRALIFGRREKEVHRNLCGENTIQIIPDNSEKGFHIQVSQ
jgi:hypothetical protein